MTSKFSTRSFSMIMSAGKKIYGIKLANSRNLTLVLENHGNGAVTSCHCHVRCQATSLSENDAVSIRAKEAEKATLPSVIRIIVDIFKNDIKEFYSFIWSNMVRE